MLTFESLPSEPPHDDRPQYDIKQQKAVLLQMKEYPLKRGQALWLGPLSVAYLAGDYQRAPWLMPNVRAPNGKRLPDMRVLERDEWATK